MGSDTGFRETSRFPPSRVIWTKFCLNNDQDKRTLARRFDNAVAASCAIDYGQTCFRGSVDQAQPGGRKRLRSVVPRRPDEGRASPVTVPDSLCLGSVG